MNSRWKRWAAVGTLAVTLVAWGCDTTTSPPTPVEAMTPADGDPDALLRRITGQVLRTLTPVTKGARALTEGVVSGVIGVAGGVLELDGHALSVPAGAVASPTLFSLTLLPGDEIVVDLRAVDVPTGVDVGGKGFAQPVRLALSYAGTDVTDPSTLVVVRILDSGSVALPTTVDTARKVAWTDLDHFSRYGLCER